MSYLTDWSRLVSEGRRIQCRRLDKQEARLETLREAVKADPDRDDNQVTYRAEIQKYRQLIREMK